MYVPGTYILTEEHKKAFRDMAEKMSRENNTKEKALAFLVKEGIVQEDGTLHPNYR